MEQLAAWLDHPWKSMKNSFQVTEDYLGGLITCVAQQSICIGQLTCIDPQEEAARVTTLTL
eukprot:4629229-Ditylum_brightwellii.AAC.1